jgi:endonuclease G
VTSPRAADDPQIRRATEVRRAAAGRLRGYPNVTGVGVGFREVAGARTDQVAIRVYVDPKLPRARLADAEVLPAEIGGIPVDVIQARFEVHGGPDPTAEHRLRHAPMTGGISIGNLVLGGSGTLGGSVFDNRTQRDLMLSNWHVLCGSLTCAAGEPIIQPGTGGGDTGTAADVVGRLHRFVIDERVDAAVALPSGHRFLRRDLLNLGSFAGTTGPVLGAGVRKSGRTTGVTEAVISDVSAEVDVVGYPQGTLTFDDQIVIENGDPSAPGDSGSLWIDNANRVVGLNFAGSSGRAVANPIDAVIEALDINVDRGITMQHFLAAICPPLL